MKRTIFTAITAMLVLSTAISAQAAHTHEYTRQNSKVYVCECGKEKSIYSLKGEKVVTLNCNGGSLYGGIYKTDITEMITEQNKIKLPLPYRSSDYQFEGWFTENGEKVSSDNEYYSDTTLYARWSLTGTRTLTFATEDGSYITPVIKPLGTTISLAEFIPTKYGYDFDGWYSDPQTKENRVTEFTFNESDTVYAKWIPNGTAVYKAPVVQNVATADEVLAFGNYIDEKTGVPVTKQWVEQNKRLNELMEVYNDKFRK